MVPVMSVAAESHRETVRLQSETLNTYRLLMPVVRTLSPVRPPKYACQRLFCTDDVLATTPRYPAEASSINDGCVALRLCVDGAIITWTKETPDLAKPDKVNSGVYTVEPL